MNQIMSSKIYSENFVLNYTEKTETDVSKLFHACVMDEQALLVSYMLRNNPSLLNVHLAD